MVFNGNEGDGQATVTISRVGNNNIVAVVCKYQCYSFIQLSLNGSHF